MPKKTVFTSRIILCVTFMTLFLVIGAAVRAAGVDTFVYLPAVFNPFPPVAWPEVGVGSATEGGISNNSSWSFDPSLAVAPDGTPYVAWSNEIPFTSNYEIYVRRWNGSNWVEVGAGSAAGGGVSNTSGPSGSQSLAFTANGLLYLAWADTTSGNSEIYVRRWNGSSWEEVGAGSAMGGGISNNGGQDGAVSLAIGPGDAPYVAWQNDTNGNGEIYVRRWNGSNWEEVGTGSATGGGISNDAGFSISPSLAVSPAGIPYVAWTNLDISQDDEIYVRRWNGTVWEEVGGGSASGGGISNESKDSGIPSIAIAPDGTPYVAWQNEQFFGTTEEIYIRRWNGSSWEEVGLGSASGNGISNTFWESFAPSLAIALDGMLYVAWQDRGANPNAALPWEVYVLRWNGSSWEEVGPGSAAAGGISNNTGDSERVSLAVAPNGTVYVAWQDTDCSCGGYEIYVRHRPQ